MNAFRNGFLGAFVLAWEIVTAIPRVCAAFLRGDPPFDRYR